MLQRGLLQRKMHKLPTFQIDGIWGNISSNITTAFSVISMSWPWPIAFFKKECSFFAKLKKKCHMPSMYHVVIPGMCGAELFPAGRGEDENPRGGPGRGGAKIKIRGAGQKSA